MPARVLRAASNRVINCAGSASRFSGADAILVAQLNHSSQFMHRHRPDIGVLNRVAWRKLALLYYETT